MWIQTRCCLTGGAESVVHVITEFQESVLAVGTGSAAVGSRRRCLEGRPSLILLMAGLRFPPGHAEIPAEHSEVGARMDLREPLAET
jgi:hypothetical protein